MIQVIIIAVGYLIMNKEIIEKATNTYNEIMKKKQELVQVKQKFYMYIK